MNYNHGLVWSVATQFVPNCRAAVLLVNSKEGRANASGGTAVVDVGDALDPDDDINPLDFEPERWMHVILHELGHALFGLADEYDHFLGCGEDTDRDHPLPGFEPSQPNLTRAAHLDNLKWRHHVPDGVDVPTKPNPDCRECPGHLTNPFIEDEDHSADTIGLFEGAGYFHCDFYRPAHHCRMNVSSHDFCYVCLEAIYNELAPLLPNDATITAEPKAIPVINACVGQADAHVRRFHITNFGNESVDARLTASHPAVQVTPANVFKMQPGRFIECTATMSTQSAAIAETEIEIAVVDETTGDELAVVTGSIEVCTPSEDHILLHAGAEVATNRWALDLGNVVRGHTTMHRLILINAPSCCPAAFTASVSVVNGPSFFVAPGQVNPIELSPPSRTGSGGRADFWFGFTSGTLGTETGALRIDLATLSGPFRSVRIDVDVSVKVVDPPAFDVVLAIDRSGSMDLQTASNGPRRIEVVFEAVDLFLAMLRDDDRVGLVRFNGFAVNPTDILVPLTAAGAANGRNTVQAVLNENPNSLQPAGSTSLGAGGNMAMEILLAGSSATTSLTYRASSSLVGWNKLITGPGSRCTSC